MRSLAVAIFVLGPAPKEQVPSQGEALSAKAPQLVLAAERHHERHVVVREADGGALLGSRGEKVVEAGLNLERLSGVQCGREAQIVSRVEDRAEVRRDR